MYHNRRSRLAILKSGGGAIVNNASLLALKPSARSPIYSASKAAVVSLTKSAALEFAARGVRVNAICAAIIETDMTVGIRTDERMRSQLLALHPIGRFGHVEEDPPQLFISVRLTPVLLQELLSRWTAGYRPD